MHPTESAPEAVGRLWQSARFLPQTVRLLGTRYRSMFLSYARNCEATGEHAAVADALAFSEFMLRQNRMALLEPERRALSQDSRQLSRRFKLRREGARVSVVERWKILQWLGL